MNDEFKNADFLDDEEFLQKNGGILHMKLKTCMEIGKSCGLTKIEECYDNIYLHSSMMFKYQDINKEIEEIMVYTWLCIFY